MKATVASLHAIFNVDEFKLDRERKLIEKLEEVELELKPLEAVGDFRFALIVSYHVSFILSKCFCVAFNVIFIHYVLSKERF